MVTRHFHRKYPQRQKVMKHLQRKRVRCSKTMFKTARVDRQPPLARIPIFNKFTSSKTHLNRPQTVPVPEMAATLRQDLRVRRSALQCSMRQISHQKYQQRQILMMHLQRKRVRSSNQRTSRRTTALHTHNNIQHIHFLNNTPKPPANRASP